MKKLQYTTNQPAATTDYLAADNTWKTIPGGGGGGGVPYTGATANVDLGEYGLDAGFVSFDTTPTGTPTTQGTMSWDVDHNTVQLVMNGTTGRILEDVFYIGKNQTGSTIPKGTVVRADGTLGASGRIKITPFLADGTYPSEYLMGVTAEAIANGADGMVVHFGQIRNVNTSAYSNGDILYASPSSAGAFTTTIPSAPNNIIEVAIVIYAAANGILQVRPTIGSNINKDEGVIITSPSNGQVLTYNSTSGLWQNNSIKTINGNSIIGSGNELVFNYDRAKYGFEGFSDFISPAVGNNTIDPSYTVFVGGAGAATLISGAPSVRATNQQGFIQPSTGTTLSGHAGIYGTTSGNNFMALGGGAVSFATSILIPTLSTLLQRYRIVLGFGTTALNTSDITGIFFTYDEGGIQNGTSASPNWQCITSVSSVRTLTVTSVAASTTAWQKFSIEINAASTFVEFYIDNVLVATHTTNIPTGITQLVTPKIQIGKSIGITASTFFADYFGYKQTYTTPRI
jgi:hypothetical protein